MTPQGWIQMAKRILSSSKNHGPTPPVASNQPQSNWRTTYQQRSRIAPATMSSSRSEANLPSLRLPDGALHPSLDHFGGNNHLTMLKTKVWYHSQRNVQEAS